MRNKLLTVWTQLVLLGWDVKEDEPKLEDSWRDLALDDGTITELRRWRARQMREQKEWGDAWVATGYIFTRENGNRAPCLGDRPVRAAVVRGCDTRLRKPFADDPDSPDGDA